MLHDPKEEEEEEEQEEEEEDVPPPPLKRRKSGPGMGKSGVKQLSGLQSISDDNLSEALGYSTQRVDIALAQH